MRQRGDLELHPFTVAFGDLALTFLAYQMAFQWGRAGAFPPQIQLVAPWVGLVTVFLIHTLNLAVVSGRTPGHAVRNVIASTLVISTGAFLVTVLVWDLPLKWETVLLPVAFQVAALIPWRLFCAFAGARLRGHRRVLIIGNASEIQYLGAQLTALGTRSYECVATVETVAEALPLLADVNSVLVAPSVSHEAKRQIVTTCLLTGQECLVVPDSYEISLFQAEVRQMNDLPVLSVKPIGLSRVELLAKRLLDLVGASVGLLLLLPVWLLIALAIRITSPGSVFFLQERMGRGERLFRCIKFRTMIADAEAQTGPVLESENDPRVTPVGRFLRASRLDETPQLINVLRGEMSLVGPRPERPFFVEMIAETLPEFRYRLLVQPGLTGLAQVEAGYDTRPEDKLRYDLLYIQNFSLLLDLKLLLATVRVVLFPRRFTAGSPSVLRTPMEDRSS